MEKRIIKTFEDLECWKTCSELRRELYLLTRSFPREEKYSLVSQIIRASRSVTNNIAEGYGRFHYQENTQFCRQGIGSLYEIIDHLIIAKDLEYLNAEKYQNFRILIDKCLALLNGYINYLKKAKTINE